MSLATIRTVSQTVRCAFTGQSFGMSACAIPNARALGYSWRFFSEADCVRESGLLCARPPLCHAPLCLVTFHVCPQATLLPSRVTNGSFGLHLFCVFIVPCHQDRLCPPRCLSRRQRPCVLKGVLQMATLFAVCSFPRCIHAPWVWSLIVSVRSSWSLEICPLEFVISFFAMLRVSGSRSHALPSRWVQPVPVFPFCLRVLSCARTRTSGHAEFPREVATHLGAQDESSTTGVAAPQSQPSLG